MWGLLDFIMLSAGKIIIYKEEKTAKDKRKRSEAAVLGGAGAAAVEGGDRGPGAGCPGLPGTCPPRETEPFSVSWPCSGKTEVKRSYLSVIQARMRSVGFTNDPDLAFPPGSSCVLADLLPLALGPDGEQPCTKRSGQAVAPWTGAPESWVGGVFEFPAAPGISTVS